MDDQPDKGAALARFGSFMLCSKKSFGDDGTLYEVASALEADGRVKWVQCPWGFKGNRCYVRTIYPGGAEAERLIDGADTLHGAQFNSFLEFEVEDRDEVDKGGPTR